MERIPNISIRQVSEEDVETIVELTIQEFRSASIDAAIQDRLGGIPWQETKTVAVRSELHNNPEGCFVALVQGVIAGYVTTTLNVPALRGTIANLAVGSAYQGQGIGRSLVVHALSWFRNKGLQQAKIETLESNQAGYNLYTSCGFQEVVRQIHFILPLNH